MNSDRCKTCRRKLCTVLIRRTESFGQTLRCLGRGDRLQVGSNSCMRFWIVVHGTAAICTSFPDGRRQITGLEMSGDTVCGLSASSSSPTWLEALEDCEICEIDCSGQPSGLREDPAFLGVMFHLIHRRLEATSRHLTALGRLDSTERVTLFLAEMAQRDARANGAPVRLPMSREDIADYLGLNAETVSRILGRLKKSGMVRFLSPTEYVLPDMDAIRRRLPVPLSGVAVDPMAVLGEVPPKLRKVV